MKKFLLLISAILLGLSIAIMVVVVEDRRTGCGPNDVRWTPGFFLQHLLFKEQKSIYHSGTNMDKVLGCPVGYLRRFIPVDIILAALISGLAFWKSKKDLGKPHRS